MLMTDDGGMFQCHDCDYRSLDIFDFLEHCGLQYSWMVQLDKNYSFNLFNFLKEISHLIVYHSDEDEALELVQNTALLMVNATDGTLNKFMEEVTVKIGVEDLLDGLEAELGKE